MNFNEKATLGRTGIKAGKLGISSSFGAPAAAYEEAFEKGCNYFTLGSFMKGRSSKMTDAIKNISGKGKREELIVSMLTYAHSSFLTERFIAKGLKALGIEYTDFLILGYFPKRPSQRIIDGAIKLKEKGLVRHLGLTSHNRKLFPEINKEGIFDLFHLRYNAAHRGAETESFPFLTGENRPGIVSFTATRWKKLLDQKKMPEGVKAPDASDCYRFVLTNPSVDVCMMGANSVKQMQENLNVLELGPMNEEEITRMKKIGDHLRGMLY